VEYLWTLKNYSSLIAIIKESKITSPEFSGGSHFRDLKWHLQLYVENANLGIILGVRQMSDPPNKVTARYEICVLDPEGHRTTFGAGNRNNESKDFTNARYKNKCLVPLYNVKPLLKDTSLRIHCMIWIDMKIAERSGSVSDCLQSAESLVKDYKSLMNNSELADFVIKTKTRSFSVHKCILAARSSVFDAMIKSGMREAQNNTVDIEEFDDDTVSAMIEYIYAGETNLKKDKLCEVLKIAEKYDLPQLRKMCEFQLCENITMANIAKALSTAYLYDSEMLKRIAIDFIISNKDEVKRRGIMDKVAQRNPSILVDLFTFL